MTIQTQTAQLRLAVADDDPETLQFITHALDGLGHHVVSSAQTGEELIAHCRSFQPDAAITDIMMPDMDGLEAAGRIYADRPIPIVIVSAYYDPEFIDRAGRQHVLSYLTKPVKQADLAASLELATRRFQEFRALESETQSLRQALQDRKIIERAKGILMKQAQLDEPEAFARLQKLARNNNRKLVDVAQSIVVAADALRPDGHE